MPRIEMPINNAPTAEFTIEREGRDGRTHARKGREKERIMRKEFDYEAWIWVEDESIGEL